MRKILFLFGLLISLNGFSAVYNVNKISMVIKSDTVSVFGVFKVDIEPSCVLVKVDDLNFVNELYIRQQNSNIFILEDESCEPVYMTINENEIIIDREQTRTKTIYYF